MRILRCFTSRPLKIVVGAMLFALSMGATAQENSASASAYYEDAVERFNEEKYDEAVIQLKNALQVDPRLLPAIVLLGEAYRKTGNPAAAETAFADAIAAGADMSLVAIPRAQTYIAQFKHELLLAEPLPQGLRENVLAELHTIRARAALETSNQKALEQELASAEAIDPDNGELLFLQVAIAIQKGQISKAENTLRRLKILYPGQENTLLARASITHRKGSLNSALEEYDAVIRAYPKNIEARLARVGILFDLGRHDATTEDLTILVNQTSSDPRVNYLKSVKLEKEGDIAGVRNSLAATLNVLDILGPEIVLVNQQFSLIGGMANYKLNNSEATRTYLENYLNIGGNDPSARIALAKTYAKNQNYRGAIRLAEVLLRERRLNLELIQLATAAYHAMGEHGKAVSLLESVTRALSNSTALNVQLALSRIEAGHTQQGVAELEALYINTDTRVQTAIPLAVTYLDQKQFDKAFGIAQKLFASSPEDITYINLLGLAEVGRGNLDLARSNFEKILVIDPQSVAAHINLAKLDVRAEAYQAAANRLNKLQEQNPTNEQVMLELSRTYQRQGENVRDALKWARNAYKANPDSLISSRHLIGLLISIENIEEATSIAFELEQNHPQNLDYLEIFGTVLEARQETSQLRSHLRKMTGLAANNPEWLFKIAQYQVAAGDLEESSYTLFKALQEHPDNLSAQALLVEVEIRLNRLESAKDRALKIIKENPKQDIGYALLGDSVFAANNYGDAIENFKKANQISSRTQTTLKLYLANRKNGNTAAAVTTLTNRLKLHPDDARVRSALADHYLATQAYAKAKAEYIQLLERNPDDTRLLNNLANTLLNLNEFDAALNYARRAQSLAPANPFANDTLGWLLTINHEYEEGIGFLREALARASTNPEIRYHLATNLAGQNRKREAINELKGALATGTVFEGKRDAEALLAKLQEI